MSAQSWLLHGIAAWGYTAAALSIISANALLGGMCLTVIRYGLHDSLIFRGPAVFDLNFRLLVIFSCAAPCDMFSRQTAVVCCRQLETDRMQQVLAHPQYMANPLAAIRNHLEATLPAAAPPKPPQHNKLSKAQLRRRKQAGTDSMQS